MDGSIKIFGLAIAHVIPGFIALAGMSEVMPRLKAWFGTAASQEVTVGGFLFVLCASIAISLVTGAVRTIVFETWLKIGAEASRPSLQKRVDTAGEAVYQNVVLQHYVYYQFYSNTFFTLPVAAVCWGVGRGLSGGWWALVIVGLAALEPVLFFAAKDSMKRFLTKKAEILSLVKQSA